MSVGVRERILAIRLMEKANAAPAVAAKLGIVAIYAEKIVKQKEDRSDGKER